MSRCLPPPLMTSELGSFARQTIVERKPQIIASVLADNNYASEVRWALAALADEIASRPVARPVGDIPLGEEWLAECDLWQGRGWLDVPWYFAEAYFYLRLLDAAGYLGGGIPDPFQKQKDALLAQCASIVPSLARAQTMVESLPAGEAFAVLARRSLWGNRLDLSNAAVSERHRADPSHLDDTDVAVDNLDAAFALLSSRTERPVVFICDNCGPEVVADLHLADWLLARDQLVAFELKSQPFFVSDAMVKDARAAITYLGGCELDAAREVGARLRAAEANGRLQLRSHPFWTGPHHYNRLPGDLSDRLSPAALVIAKGDVNYRRFLRDRHWPYTTPIIEVVDYFPADALLLRTLKGELVAGLDEATVARLSATAEDWLTNGQHGLAQLAPRRR